MQRQSYLQADETPIRVLDRNKPGTTHQGYHWAYHAPLLKINMFSIPKRAWSGRPGRIFEEFSRNTPKRWIFSILNF